MPGRLSALHITHRLDNKTVVHTHQIDAPNRSRVAGPKAPADDGAVSHHKSLFEIKMAAGAVAISVHRAIQASRPIQRSPLGAGLIFSITQFSAIKPGSAVGSCCRNTSLKRS